MSWDKKNIETTNWFNKKRYEKMRLKIINYDEDLKTVVRREKLNCKSCTYISNDCVSMSVCSEVPCSMCGIEVTSSNSNVDKLCFKCAKEHNLCVKCGGNLD